MLPPFYFLRRQRFAGTHRQSSVWKPHLGFLSAALFCLSRLSAQASPVAPDVSALVEKKLPEIAAEALTHHQDAVLFSLAPLHKNNNLRTDLGTLVLLDGDYPTFGSTKLGLNDSNRVAGIFGDAIINFKPTTMIPMCGCGIMHFALRVRYNRHEFDFIGYFPEQRVYEDNKLLASVLSAGTRDGERQINAVLQAANVKVTYEP